MAVWLYQMNQRDYPPNRYRLEIWENKRCPFLKGRKASTDSPKPGDKVVLFYARKGGPEPGFYGWAIVLAWRKDRGWMDLRPVAPSDALKMHPWWDKAAKEVADKVRGKVMRWTLWKVPDELAAEIFDGITAWLNGSAKGRLRS